jgi:hypothetical protein
MALIIRVTRTLIKVCRLTQNMLSTVRAPLGVVAKAMAMAAAPAPAHSSECGDDGDSDGRSAIAAGTAARKEKDRLVSTAVGAIADERRRGRISPIDERRLLAALLTPGTAGAEAKSHRALVQVRVCIGLLPPTAASFLHSSIPPHVSLPPSPCSLCVSCSSLPLTTRPTAAFALPRQYVGPEPDKFVAIARYLQLERGGGGA